MLLLATCCGPDAYQSLAKAPASRRTISNCSDPSRKKDTIRPVIYRLLALAAPASIGGMFKPVTVFGADHQVRKSREMGSEFAPVGMIYDLRTRRSIVATLVDPCHVLTAFHFIASRADAAAISFSGETPLRFLVGPHTDKSAFTQSVHATPVVWGKFDHGSDNGWSTDEDWMLLELSDCVGSADRYGFIKADPVSAAELVAQGRPISLLKAGYPKNKNVWAGIWVDEDCTVRAVMPLDIWHHDCAVVSGDSGASLFYRTTDGALRLVAIQSNGYPGWRPLDHWDPLLRNAAVSVGHFYEKIRPYLQDHP